MYEHVEKPKENKDKAVTNSVAQKKSDRKQGFGFVDNRPGVVGQREIIKSQNSLSQKSIVSLAVSPCNTEDKGNSKESKEVIQAIGLANVHVWEGQNQELYVGNVVFKERVPTDSAGSGQGDHTVAETLIEESLKALVGLSIPYYLHNLLGVIERHFSGDEAARHTDEAYDETMTISPTSVYQNVQSAIERWHDIPPTELPDRLSNLTTQVWRLLSKRAMTAFNRSEGRTSGGGHGAGEREAMGHLRGLEVPQSGWNQGPFIEQVVGILVSLVDVNIETFSKEQQVTIFRRAAEHAGDSLGIPSSDWKNRVAASLFNRIHGDSDRQRMAPQTAPQRFQPE